MTNTFEPDRLELLPNSPGVYKMLDASGKIIYVGKAKNIKNRVTSYFKSKSHNLKTQTLVSNIVSIAVITTHTEKEALILEHNLIKKFLPKYNILFKDGKSYPYLVISNHSYPRLTVLRKTREHPSLPANSFGPYTDTKSLYAMLETLQATFKLRDCSDNFFANRIRPCLQYQIKRCSAPCVKYISEQEYSNQVQLVKDLLQGKSDAIRKSLTEKMQQAAAKTNYEQAAVYRNQIRAINHLLEQQVINVNRIKKDIDIIAIAKNNEYISICIVSTAAGEIIDTNSIVIDMPDLDYTDTTIFEQFLIQHYRDNQTPDELVINVKYLNQLIFDILTNDMQVKLLDKDEVKKDRSSWYKLAEDNAKQALITKMRRSQQYEEKFLYLANVLSMHKLNTIACFDISHHQGEATSAACVVFSSHGPQKKEWRNYKITSTDKGDDLIAMQEAVARYLNRYKENKENLLLVIDGGKTQYKAVENKINTLNLDAIPRIISVSKGEGRKIGNETIYLSNNAVALIQPFDIAFNLLIHIRNEAHNYAISAQRRRYRKQKLVSQLDKIPNVGKQRRLALIEQLGGIEGVKSASIKQLESVKGISSKLAAEIYAYLNG